MYSGLCAREGGNMEMTMDIENNNNNNNRAPRKSALFIQRARK